LGAIAAAFTGSKNDCKGIDPASREGKKIAGESPAFAVKQNRLRGNRFSFVANQSAGFAQYGRRTRRRGVYAQGV
jgi:hypothetical protein